MFVWTKEQADVERLDHWRAVAWERSNVRHVFFPAWKKVLLTHIKKNGLKITNSCFWTNTLPPDL